MPLRKALRSHSLLNTQHMRHWPNALHRDGLLFAGHETAPAPVTCLGVHLRLELLRAGQLYHSYSVKVAVVYAILASATRFLVDICLIAALGVVLAERNIAPFQALELYTAIVTAVAHNGY
jgi:hypothetical protein